MLPHVKQTLDNFLIHIVLWLTLDGQHLIIDLRFSGRHWMQILLFISYLFCMYFQIIRCVFVSFCGAELPN